MTISLRLTKEDALFVKTYAKQNNMTVSQLFRTIVLDKIEDEYDAKACIEAIKEFEKDPKTYTMEEVEKELGLKCTK